MEQRFVFGPLGPSYHDLMGLSEKDEDHQTPWKYVSHATPALPFPPLPPMYIPGWSPAKYCSHCGTNMHRTNECMSHAMKIVQSAARSLKQRGFVFTGPDITQHGMRQRLHEGPGWSIFALLAAETSGRCSSRRASAVCPIRNALRTAGHLSSSANPPTPTRHQ